MLEVFGRMTKVWGAPIKQSLVRTFTTGRVKSGDPYKMLEASRNEDFGSIKKKYYKLVNLYHPDKNGTEVITFQTGSEPHFQTDP